MADPQTPTAERKTPCPICGKPALAEFRPFCSRRCADVDLGRWLSGGYRLPDPDPPSPPPAALDPEEGLG